MVAPVGVGKRDILAGPGLDAAEIPAGAKEGTEAERPQRGPDVRTVQPGKVFLLK
jgi:hypothetical protein